MVSKFAEITGHSGAIYDIASWDNSVFSASADGYIAKWNLDTNTQDGLSIKCSAPPYSLVITNNNLWFGLSNGDIHVIDLLNKIELKFFQQHRHAIFSIVSIPEKNLIIAADADGNLTVWNSISFELLLFIPLTSGKIRKINVQSGGEMFVVHGQDGKIRIFETTQFNEIITLTGHENGACCSVFSAIHDELLISGGKDGLLKIWDWKNEKLIKTIPAHNFAIYDIQALNNPFLISASRDKSIKLWDAETFEFLNKIELKNGGHKHSVNTICLLDENQFISGSDDQKMMRWQVN